MQLFVLIATRDGVVVDVWSFTERDRADDKVRELGMTNELDLTLARTAIGNVDGKTQILEIDGQTGRVAPRHATT